MADIIYRIDGGAWTLAEDETLPFTIPGVSAVNEVEIFGHTDMVVMPVPAPVIYDFVDNLGEDPPNVLFSVSQDGTLTWDFHSSATPPTPGAGDIGTGTEAVSAGAVDLDLDLSAYPEETGYLHFSVANVNGTSNVETSQEITVPSGDLVQGAPTLTNGTFADGTSSSTGSPMTAEWSVAITEGVSYTVEFDADSTNAGNVVYIRLGSTSNKANEPITPAGEHVTKTVTADGVNTTLALVYVLTTGSGTISNVSLVPA